MPPSSSGSGSFRLSSDAFRESPRKLWHPPEIALGIASILVLVAISRWNYLLFHTLAELYGIVIAVAFFVSVWNGRELHENGFFLFLGISAAAASVIDLFHTFGYRGMGIFPGIDTDVPTQLWICARWLQAVSLLIAPSFLQGRLRAGRTLAVYMAAVLAVLGLVFRTDLVPACWQEDTGLTQFKIVNEYLICLVICGAILRFRTKRDALSDSIRKLIVASLVATIVSELAFTFYVSVYGLSNLLGHLAKIVAGFLVYKAFIRIGLARPHETFFRNLERSRKELGTILDSVPAWIYYKNRENRYLRVNRAMSETLGIPADGFAGRSAFDIFTAEEARAVWKDDLEVVASGTPKLGIDETHRTPSGPRRFRTDKIPYRNDEGAIVGIIGFSVDVTEQANAEERIVRMNETLEERVRERTARLETANKELEAFSYSVSHDLRSPLRALDGFSEVLLRHHGHRLDEEGRRLLGRIQASARRMEGLIRDLLELSRIVRSEFSASRVDLSAMAVETAAAIREEYPGRDLRFDVDPEMHVRGDPRFLRILMRNLLDNAVKFTAHRSPAHIRAGVRELDGEPEYFVRDDGIGFDMAYADRLFVPFQRLHGAAEYPGTGIGLVLAQRIVERHGGRIRPESAEGAGTTMYFTLPVPSTSGESVGIL